MQKTTKKYRFLEHNDSKKSNSILAKSLRVLLHLIKKAIIDYSTEVGRNIPFSGNDKDRMGVVCSNKDKGFPWRIWASWERGK